VLTLPGELRDEVPAQDSGAAVTLTYRVQTGDVTEAAQILRERLSAVGISAEVAAGDRMLTITAPDAARADVAALTAPGRLAIYDWERSVLGPDGRPAPTDPAVTGGPDAGHAAALTEVQAQSRADKSPGARAVQADRGWFALGGDPALTEADVASARAETDPATGDPIVALELTPPGRQAFTALTRVIAQRGADQGGTGDPLQDAQHLALVLDDRIVSTPFIDPRVAPDGIDGAAGAHLSGLPTPEQAQLTAALLSAGPLPGRLEPLGR
jgi:preprotein translocase subunit SecD